MNVGDDAVAGPARQSLYSGAQRREAPSTRASFWSRKLGAAAVTAVLVFVLQYFPDAEDGSGSILGALAALVAVAIGLAAVDGPRALPRRSPSEHAGLLVRALAIGIALGFANLGLNYGMAVLDPAIREQMVTRWSETSTWSIVLSGPVLEEIVFRLMLMSVIGWIAARFTSDRRTVFLVALGVSSVVFGVAHIFYGGVDTLLYQLGIALKTSALALVLGWMFWRWGLPYAIAAHCAANALHLMLWRGLF